MKIAKRFLIPIMVAVIVVSLIIVSSSCYTNTSYYPKDGKEAINTGVINYEGYGLCIISIFFTPLLIQLPILY